jgi:transposase
MSYSSSLTDAEWEIFEPLLLEILPKKKRTRPCDWSKRELIDGMLYQLKNGCNWKDLPKEFPPYSTVYPTFRTLSVTLKYLTLKALTGKGYAILVQMNYLRLIENNLILLR